ncbi:MAG: hypothetical protein S4CHLAM2_15010 [Chlamydiales bacterium]|nr:hypothetical protein [Chlamydiales bacterium]
MKKAIVISASSDIGAALCQDWTQKGWEVIGTYRTSVPPADTESLFCDLLSPHSIENAAASIQKKMPNWDVLVCSSGTLNPIGPFETTPFSNWEQGIEANFLRPLQMVHALLPYRSEGATVLFFAGAGTNSAAPNYSAYALSKIALIKMCELLDAEMPDVRFVIVGPGWVKTKIHEETIQAKTKAGSNLERTLDRLKDQKFTSMEEVVACCNWLIHSSNPELGGRNYSVVYDPWGEDTLENHVKQNPDFYKLRREGNQTFPPKSNENNSCCTH